jgi:hypothetical protein
MLRLGGRVLGELLSADPGYRGPRVACGNGHEAVFTGYRGKVTGTVVGEARLRRAWYHCARCKRGREHGRGLAPRDAELGITGTSLSPGLAAMAATAGAAVPFARATRLLQELPGTEGRDGKGEDGRARTREVKMAVFFTQHKLDAKGYPVRDRASSSYIATFEPAAAFGDLVKAEGIRRGSDHVRQMTVIGDGAAWIRGIATAKFPEATQIAGLYHAREHLHSLTRSLEFMLGDRKEEWLAARLEDLDYGYIDGIEAAVRRYPLEGVKKAEAERELGYFLNNAPRMRYHWFRRCGLFVGSGVIEAGCKSVVGQRLKQSGMHWTVAGADSIIALRCAETSNQWEATCRNQHNQTPAA